MKGKIFLTCLGLACILEAREFRTPLNVQQGTNGYFHAPLELEDEELEHKIKYDIWGAAYAQSAHKVYNNCHDKVNVAQIFFGKDSFRGKEVFANSTVSSSGDAAATWLSFALLSPRVEYSENGAVFGGTIAGSWKDDTLRFGVRANLPYKVVEMHSDDSSGGGLGEETIQDVCRRQSDLFLADTDPRVTLDTTIDNDWACRLDFVSSLCSASCTIPLVQYGTGAGDPTRIHGKDVTDTGNLSPDPDFDGNPVHLLQVAVGNVPTGLLGGVWNTDIASTGFVSGSGTGPGVGNRTRFDDGIDYTALAGDIDAQSQFWVVPTLVKNGAANELATTDDANEIRNMIEQLTNQIDFSAANFFFNNCISFATQKTRGIGDLDTELFVGYFFNKKTYGELQLGFSFPTGKKVKEPNLLYKTPTGNNGHMEIDLGAMAWFHAIDTVVLKGDASYHWVLESSERVAAPFVGATVKNINPILDADISWRYFIGHLDLTFLHPENPGLGFDVGYEFYWKKKDQVDFKCLSCPSSSCNGNSNGICIPFSTVSGNTATDFFGNSQTLDACVLEKYTNRVSHKLKVEFFHHWNFGDLHAGWSQVFYGKNVMQETSYYLGMSINF